MDDDDSIVIVGVGCKFPGADNLDEFWRVLSEGENHVIEIPRERWKLDAFYDKDPDIPGKTYVRHAGLLKRQFQNCRRETKDVKKKYFNTKQRAKAKLDSARHPGTGGGPPPESPSAAEEIILAATGSRPGMMGIPSGIDTDAVLPICPERGVCSADSLNEIQAALPSTNGSGNTTFTVSCSDVPSCSDAPNVATCSTTVTVTDEPISGKRLSTSHCDESRSKKQKTTSVLTEKNLLLDNQRLQEEIEKIKEDRKRIKTESEKLEKEKQVLDLKFAYWTLKLQHEFQF